MCICVLTRKDAAHEGIGRQRTGCIELVGVDLVGSSQSRIQTNPRPKPWKANLCSVLFRPQHSCPPSVGQHGRKGEVQLTKKVKMPLKARIVLQRISQHFGAPNGCLHGAAAATTPTHAQKPKMQCRGGDANERSQLLCDQRRITRRSCFRGGWDWAGRLNPGHHAILRSARGGRRPGAPALVSN